MYNIFIRSFHLEEWTSPLNEGDNRPPPLGGHRIAKFDNHRAVLFGGKGPPGHIVTGRSNDVWILDLVNMVRILIEHIAQ